MATGGDAIGIFDSGVGGLTVLHALLEALPQEDLVYLGDTGRYPYGTKSAETVTRYSIENVDFLIAKGIKLLVVACNTASSVALAALAARYPVRSEEHTSELQSRLHLVCRLLLEKKKQNYHFIVVVTLLGDLL